MNTDDIYLNPGEHISLCVAADGLRAVYVHNGVEYSRPCVGREEVAWVIVICEPEEPEGGRGDG